MGAKVVIIGHGYTSRLGIIRSLAEIGCDITVIVMVFFGRLGRLIRFDGGKPIDCCSKYVNKVLYCRAKSETDLINLLLAKCSDPSQKTVIIPDSDFSASVVDKYQEKLKDYFLFPHINKTPGAVEQWMDKLRQKKLAQEIGIPVATGVVTHVSSEGFEIPKTIKYPCFTKPLITINGGKQFLCKCEDETKLRRVLSEMGQHFNADVLIEEFKQIDEEYAVLGFSDGQNVAIPAVIQFISNSASHFGIARQGVVMPIDGFERIIDSFKSFVQRIGFFGLFDIDFYKSDGVVFFGELNLRFGGSGYAVTKMGVNLPAMFVKAISGDTQVFHEELVSNKAVYVNERMCIDDWSFYHISEGEFDKMMKTADIHFVYDDEDKGPQRKLERYLRQQRIKRVLRKIIKKLRH